MRDGGLVVVASMDRLARSLIDLETIVRELIDKGVIVSFVKENLTFSPGTDDAFATFQMQLIGAVAQLERSLIRERQAEGIAAAKARGVYKGRAKALTPEQVERARELVRSGVPKARIAREFGVGRTTIYRALEGE